MRRMDRDECQICISIHAPREGSDWQIAQKAGKVGVFLSTLPARGATCIPPVSASDRVYFYPRSPRGERRIRSSWKRTKTNFYPRSPRGERLDEAMPPRLDDRISIHAPREGSDQRLLEGHAVPGYISIHAPREGSDGTFSIRDGMPSAFLSTLPARGATRSRPGRQRPTAHFYPRSPRGERRGSLDADAEFQVISIHAPREGSDQASLPPFPQRAISIHAPREGSDLFAALSDRRADISIHAPREGSDLMARWASR